MSAGAANRSYAAAFVEELARSGVRHACICPGSRSTPLALALARNPKVKCWILCDERSASFFGLGMAKSLSRPVALLCTSGTAAANFLPAIVEARYSRVPLLVLTADRPHELRDTEAPQAIDQIKLYGSFVKWFVEMAMPELSELSEQYARAIAGRAVARARATPAGPVHLNFPFREPLTATAGSSADIAGYQPADEDKGGDAAQVFVTTGARVLAPAEAARLTTDLRGADRTLIVCGVQSDPGFPACVARLARALGAPLLADPLSQARCGPHDRSAVVESYDALLRCTDFAAASTPDLVLRFGALPTSKPLLGFLEGIPGCRQIFVDGNDGWNNPGMLQSETYHCDPTWLCAAIGDALAQRPAPARASRWSERWTRAGRTARAAITKHLARLDELFEGKVFSELAGALPDRALLYVGNSMPVRDLDAFFGSTERTIRFLANRGANGIDGVLSSALGAGAVGGDPLVLVLGDLSFYHDMNGLLAGRLHHLRATIVILHNDGGGIFSFLPQADEPQHFEQLFGTPHGLDFSHAARMYGAGFTRVADWSGFRSAMSHGLDSTGVNIIEVPTDRARNVAIHRDIWREVASALKSADLH